MLHKICVRQVFTSLRINHLSVWQLSGCCRCFIGDKAVSRKLLPCHLLRVPADNYSSFTVQTDQQKLYCQKLKHRSLIKILGTDTYKFLQGLVTNDINLLVNAPAIYAMMLNVQVSLSTSCFVCLGVLKFLALDWNFIIKLLHSILLISQFVNRHHMKTHDKLFLVTFYPFDQLRKPMTFDERLIDYNCIT